MRKIILGLLVLMALASCSNESKMKSEIKAYLEKTAKDPKSYEFVDLKILDTVTVSKLIKNEITKNINDNQLLIDDNSGQMDLINKYPSLDNSEQYANIEINLKEIKRLDTEHKKLELDLKKEANNKDVLGYVVKHNCRLKNGFGALDLASYYVEFDKDFKLLALDKDIDYSVFKLK